MTRLFRGSFFVAAAVLAAGFSEPEPGTDDGADTGSSTADGGADVAPDVADDALAAKERARTLAAMSW